MRGENSLSIFDDCCLRILRANICSHVAPDKIEIDAGSQITATELKETAKSSGIFIKTVLMEAHNPIEKVERSHALLRSLYERIKMDLPSFLKEHIFSLSYCAINAPSSTSGVLPTILVFGITPTIPGAGDRGTMAHPRMY